LTRDGKHIYATIAQFKAVSILQGEQSKDGESESLESENEETTVPQAVPSRVEESPQIKRDRKRPNYLKDYVS